MYRVAICLHGLVGNITGKSYKNETGSKAVLKIAAEHWYDKIVDVQKNTQVDFFTHSWSTELEDKISSIFKPKKTIIEPQRVFEIPSYVRGDDNRKQAHWHRWYSCKRSVEIKRDYELENDFVYDCVMCARYDLAWMKGPQFKEHCQDYFYVSNWYDKSGRNTSPTTHKCKDLWFFSNSKNIDKFSSLYDKLDKYTQPGQSKDNKVLGVSSHYLMTHHLNQLKLPAKQVLQANKSDERNSDFPVVRLKYFDAKI